MTEFDDATMMSGSASPASGDETDEDKCPIATLWLPDPETWRGWGMRHVWRKDEKKPARAVGFRK